MVNTREPIQLSFNVGGYTAGSTQTDYLPVNIRVCGEEKVSLTTASLSKAYSKNSQNDTISSKDLSKLFTVDSAECPITSFDLVTDSEPMEQYSEDWLKIVDNQVHISPSSTQSKYLDQTFDLLIVGKTSGNSQALLPAKFEFQKLNIPEGLSGPKFEFVPSIFTVNYGFDSSGIDSSANYDVFWLPKIVDENDGKVLKIDPSTIKAKKGSN